LVNKNRFSLKKVVRINTAFKISCFYCGNPNPEVEKGSRSGKEGRSIAGLNHFLSFLKENWWSRDYETIKGPFHVKCSICDKSYSITCIDQYNCKCKDFVESLLRNTSLFENEHPDIRNFMQENNIVPEMLLKYLIAVTVTKTGKHSVIHILFDKYYVVLERSQNEGINSYSIVEMYFTEKNLRGGNFLG